MAPRYSQEFSDRALRMLDDATVCRPRQRRVEECVPSRLNSGCLADRARSVSSLNASSRVSGAIRRRRTLTTCRGIAFRLDLVNRRFHADGPNRLSWIADVIYGRSLAH